MSPNSQINHYSYLNNIQTKIKLGYWPITGTAIARLLLAYTGLSWEGKLFRTCRKSRNIT
jgi:hypothetical protein